MLVVRQLVVFMQNYLDILMCEEIYAGSSFECVIRTWKTHGKVWKLILLSHAAEAKY